jgi:hypothetical protein
MTTATTDRSSRRVVLAVGLLLAALVCAGAALAAPNIWALDAGLTEKEVITGENITVNATLKNTGDTGFLTISLSRNNSSASTSKRVRVKGNSERIVALNSSIDKPGKYNFVVDDGARKERTGTITVSDSKVSETTTRSDGRDSTVRGGTVDDSVSVDLPAATNQSIAVESVTLDPSGTAFNRTVATYAPPDNASFAIPSGTGSTVIGTVEVTGSDGVATTGLRVAVQRSAVTDASLDSESLSLYQANGSGYESVDVDRTDSSEKTIVLNATATASDQYLVGSLSPRFTMTKTVVNTRSTESGKRINLTATVRNDGAIAGSYTAPLQINGDEVASQSVTVEPGATESVTVSHVVTSDGDYDISLGNRSVGSVVLSTGPNDSTDGGPIGDVGSEPVAELPGIGAVSISQVVVGALIVAIGGAVLLFRRG